MRVLSPLSGSQVDDGDDDDPDDQEFVDAQDSQIAEPPPNPNPDSEAPFSSSAHQGARPGSPSRPRKGRKSSHMPSEADVRWRKRVEAALVKMTAEVAALREQLEARRLWSRTRQGSLLSWIWSFFSAVVKHVAVDVLVLTLVLIWFRRKNNGRLEGAVRVLLGDAVAQAQRVGTGVQKKVGRALGGVARLSS
jgi:hypothetical protein